MKLEETLSFTKKLEVHSRELSVLNTAPLIEDIESHARPKSLFPKAWHMACKTTEDKPLRREVVSEKKQTWLRIL